MSRNFYLYEIRNLLDNKIYIGAHSTNNMDDGYMGSGSRIINAIKKYGKENFVKTILETFRDEDSMFNREKEIVNKSFILRADTYNIAVGGVDGWTKSNRIMAEKRKTDPIWLEAKRKNISLGVKRAMSEGKCRCTSREFNLLRVEKSRTPESIAKRKSTYAKNRHQQGENHALYGRLALHQENIGWKWVQKELVDDYLASGWSRGKGNRLKVK